MGNDNHQFQLSLKNEAATAELATKIAGVCEPGDVIALVGDLGVGKTSFARAFISACGGDGEVPSPTFTLVQVYELPKSHIYHFDLYRIEEPEEIFELDIEDAMYSGISLIEWPDRMGSYIPSERLDIFMTNSSDENAREVVVVGHGNIWYNKLGRVLL
jgi:tRNA threonylcarbamoyladenosine biosynthesis protein TsaE